ncbi:MAG: hypothetical protein ACK5RL_09985 [Acidimicrobiales bacterium]
MTDERPPGESGSVVELGQARRRRPRPGPSGPPGPEPSDLDGLDLNGLGLDGAAADLGDDDPAALLGRLGSELPGPPTWLRIIIAVLAVGQLAVALPWLVARDPFGLLDASTGAHLTRDGALGLAVAVAALLTAWRPRWAVPAFVLAAVALVAQAAAGVLEPEVHRAASTELIHLPSVMLTVMVGLSAVRLPALGPSPPGSHRRS